MITATIREDGSIRLGDRAGGLGFRPGAVVQVSVTSAGSLLLVIDDTPPLDLVAKPLSRRSGMPALPTAGRPRL